MSVADKDVLRILVGAHASSNPGDRAVLDEWLEGNQPKDQEQAQEPDNTQDPSRDTPDAPKDSETGSGVQKSAGQTSGKGK